MNLLGKEIRRLTQENEELKQKINEQAAKGAFYHTDKMKEKNEELEMELDACLKGARIEAERADKFQQENEELKNGWRISAEEYKKELAKLKEAIRKLKMPEFNPEKLETITDVYNEWREQTKTLKAMIKEE